MNGLSSFCFPHVSGSLLVACSQFGAYVCGSDIDYNTIHGKGMFCQLRPYMAREL